MGRRPALPSTAVAVATGLQATLTARDLATAQQNALGFVSFSWKVLQLASNLQVCLPTHAADTTAIEWLELQEAEAMKSVAQLPVGVPKEANSTAPITSPAQQPMLATWFSWVSTQAAAGGGGPGGEGRGCGAGDGAGAMALIDATATGGSTSIGGCILGVS